MDEELSAELLERARRDQAMRRSLRPGHEMLEWETVVAPVRRDNTARLREIVGQHGWPGCQLVGEAGAHAAWLLAQHAPPEVQEACLPLLQDAVARGDASPADLAYLTDRVLMHLAVSVRLAVRPGAGAGTDAAGGGRTTEPRLTVSA